MNKSTVILIVILLSYHTTQAQGLLRLFGLEKETKYDEKWTLEVSVDKMGRGSRVEAKKVSSNTLEFSFPYNGKQRSTLHFIKFIENQKRVVISVDRGQFNNIYMNNSVDVKFDDNKVKKYKYDFSGDGNMNYILLNDFNSFVKSAKVSKKVMIEAKFYQSGNQILEFDLTGFDWELFVKTINK